MVGLRYLPKAIGDNTMGMEADWAKAKKDFESATGKKKPSAKFLGVFRKPSGIEAVCKSFDKAIAAKNKKDAVKAKDGFDVALAKYLTPLYDAQKKAIEANDKLMNTEIQKLEQAGFKIFADMKEEIGKLK
jgi:hypothetical protein